MCPPKQEANIVACPVISFSREVIFKGSVTFVS